MTGMSSRERILIVLVIVAAISTVFYLFVWSPQTARRDKLTASLAQKQQELERLQRLAADLKVKEQEFAELSQRIRLVEAKLPPEREIPNLIRQLQGVASEVGIKLTLIRPGPTQSGPAAAAAAQPAKPPAAGAPAAPAAAPRYQLFKLDLGFEGTYADLMAYLGRLENFPRFIVLTQVSISPTDQPRLKVTLGANTFVLKQEGAPQ